MLKMPSEEINWDEEFCRKIKFLRLNTNKSFIFKVQEDYFKPNELCEKELKNSNKDYFVNLFYSEKNSLHPFHNISCAWN